MFLLLIAGLITAPASRSALAGYIATSDPAFSWKVDNRQSDELDVSLTSGSWHGTEWRHSIVMVHPVIEDRRHVALLMITGDRVNRKADPDIAEARDLARRTRFPVAVLFNVPNQPIQGMREDDLVAWSFGKYLESGDSTWPALFPMTRAAFRAMDALQAATKSSANAIQKFVVAGESKRGWTTWLVGAVPDKRVVGIVPVSFDFLDFPAQLHRQIELWGKPSEMLASYTSAGLDKLIGSEPGKRLMALVDPISYRSEFKVPTLIVRGSNDPFWATDAARLYIDKLPRRHSILVLPNEGHDFVDKSGYHETLAAFVRACIGAIEWPGVVPLALDRPTDFRPANADVVTIWGAGNGSLDFRRSRWKVGSRKPRNGPPESIELIPGSRSRVAVFASFFWKVVEPGGIEDRITLTTVPAWRSENGGALGN